MGDLLDLAREVVTLPGWRWMPGMLARENGGPRHGQGWRLDSESVYRGRRASAASALMWTCSSQGPHVVTRGGRLALHLGGCVPDLADPATLGCLLALVREAWGQDDLAAVQIGTDGKGGQEWAVRSHLHAPRQHLGWGEAHALVAALRAAGAR